MRFPAPAWLAVACGLGAACTNDYDAFDFDAPAAGGAAGSAGSSAGSAGTSAGTGGGGLTGGTGGGGNAAATGGTAGAGAEGGAGASATGGTGLESGSGGQPTGGTGADGGSSGAGGAAAAPGGAGGAPGGAGGAPGGTGGAPGGTGGAGGVAGTGATGAGEKLCGIVAPDVCTPDEKCCYLEPGNDYCEEAAVPCSCGGSFCQTTAMFCDGHEDCPSGEMCCGVLQFGRYVRLECQQDCSGPLEREICKQGAQCADPQQVCGNGMFLPDYVFRCD